MCHSTKYGLPQYSTSGTMICLGCILHLTLCQVLTPVWMSQSLSHSHKKSSCASQVFNTFALGVLKVHNTLEEHNACPYFSHCSSQSGISMPNPLCSVV